MMRSVLISIFVTLLVVAALHQYGVFEKDRVVVMQPAGSEVSTGEFNETGRTEVRQLQMEIVSMEVSSSKAEIEVMNVDRIGGSVTLSVKCKNTAYYDTMTKRISAGEKEVFVFKHGGDCDLDYVLKPGLVER